jgi:hypothetical protein
MPSFVRYPWDRSYGRGLNAMDDQELAAHLDRLRARRAECERVQKDVAGMTRHQARKVTGEMGKELRALAMAIASAESEANQRAATRRS